MIGDGVLGQFDPAHFDDPVMPCRVWRSISTLDATPEGLGMVSTRMEVSDDCGATFTDAGLVNQSGVFIGGLIRNYEVSSLAYIPGDSKPWKMAFHVGHNKAGVDPWVNYDHSKAWIGMREAETPLGPWAPETVLMAGTAYDHDWVPLFLSTAALVSEPALLPCPDGYYLAYQANVSANAADMELRLCRISGVDKVEKGKFFTSSDIFWIKRAYASAYPALAGMVAMTAPHLFTKNGQTYILTTPVDANYNYLGVCVFKVADLEKARLEKSWFWPKLYAFVTTSANFRGAGSYSAHSTGSGITISSLSIYQAPLFQVINTGVQVG